MMPSENFITDIEATLKSALSDVSKVSINGSAVPVKIVTPDNDLVEVTYPSLTLKLTDVRRDLSRADNQRKVEKDIVNMQAKVKGKVKARAKGKVKARARVKAKVKARVKAKVRSSMCPARSVPILLRARRPSRGRRFSTQPTP